MDDGQFPVWKGALPCLRLRRALPCSLCFGMSCKQTSASCMLRVLPGLFDWSMKFQDGTRPTQFKPEEFTPERRAW